MNPMILGGHSTWLSPLLHSPLLLLPLQVVLWFERPLQSMTVWSLHSRFFTFFNCFLKVIFRFMFFPSNSLVKESKISLGVFREETRGIRWSLIESTMIFLTLTKFFLCKALASSPSRTGTFPLMQVSNSFSLRTSEIQYFHAWKLSASPNLSSRWSD